MAVKSGGGVLLVGALQIVVGLVLLGVYEGYKKHYSQEVYANARAIWSSPPPSGLVDALLSLATPPAAAEGEAAAPVTSVLQSEVESVAVSTAANHWGLASPMEMLFYFATINNIFSLLGVAGIVARLRNLVVGFFVFNLVNVVVSFNVFVDVCVSLTMRQPYGNGNLTPYENAAAAFLFFNFILSLCACVFAVKAVEEIKEKKQQEHLKTAIENSM